MKIGFYTLGCKVNQYETQAMEQLFRQRGWEVGAFEEPCDGYILNTCSVTAVADRKNRTVLRRCRREHPEAVIGVCGCYCQHAAEEVRALGADVVGGSGDRAGFVRQFLETVEDRAYRESVDNALRRRTFELLPAGGLEGRTRAMLKVQDGCRNFCTYCIIPYTRGPVRSAPLETAVEQTRALAEAGYREIVLTGIEIASWGADLPGKPPLSALTAAVCEAAPDCRIRLGSLEPRVLTEEFCAVLGALPNLCPHFHLSLQSGSDGVLRRMGRKYDTAFYFGALERLQRTFPDCAVTTDLIVGFPGETEAEFAETLAFLRRCRFASVHVFPYSRRPGTPADQMPEQIPKSVKEQRSRAAVAAAEALHREFCTSLIGRVLPVLFEEEDGPWSVGHAPNSIRVRTRGAGLHNRVLPVRAEGLLADGVFGEVVTEMQDSDSENAKLSVSNG